MKADGHRVGWHAARVVKCVAFAAFLALALGTPSWRVGPFTWWPVWRARMLAGRPADLGVLSLLPGLVVFGWLAFRFLARPHQVWRWGRLGILLPFLGLTLLALAGLEPALTWRTAVQVGGLALFWLTYLFVVNEKPRLAWPLALVVLIQGGVGVAQFLRQDDLGLTALGELSLDPSVPGTSLLAAGGRPWLRAYGLTAHPNVLGATLVILILLLLPALGRARGWRQVGLGFVLSVGLLGLLTSFSRASWLGFAVGLVIVPPLDPPLRGGGPQARGGWRRWAVLALLSIFALFLWNYRELVLSRFLNLDTALEARSLNERWRDVRLALELIAAHPWCGVGSGNALVAAQQLDPQAATVHNVPLLVIAELGLPGAVLCGWLALAGLRARRATSAPWVALLVIGLFDNTLWLTTSWRAAILLGLLAARLDWDDDEI